MNYKHILFYKSHYYEISRSIEYDRCEGWMNVINDDNECV